ncbi:MAG: putative quinol monooxygenase [Ancalomicrobiaceae bacterium]|nr:putative quinol monooxygenase [Ancalomicrobiaceae bacterium]
MASKKEAFVVIAEFTVSGEKLQAFLAVARADATNSLVSEPGCLQFDVLVAGSGPHAVAFYEVYASRAAFDAHLATPHLAAFREALTLIDHEAPPRFFTRPAKEV